MANNYDMIMEESNAEPIEPQKSQKRGTGHRQFVVNGTIVLSNTGSNPATSWFPFYWEFMLPWITGAQNFRDIKSYIYYKPKTVSVLFYNPIATYQTSDSDLNGLNPEAKILGFVDKNHMYSPITGPNENGWEYYDTLFSNNALRCGGMDPKTGTFKVGKTVNLNAATNYILQGQNDYYTKEMMAKQGESFGFEWSVDGPWKRTQEFQMLFKRPSAIKSMTDTSKILFSPRFDYMYYKHVLPGMSKLFRTRTMKTTENLYCWTWNMQPDKVANTEILYPVDDTIKDFPWIQENNPIPTIFLKIADIVGLQGAKLTQYAQLPFTLTYTMELGYACPEAIPNCDKWGGY